MSVPVTVKRDGWSRQDSSLFGEASQECSTETAEMKKESVYRETLKKSANRLLAWEFLAIKRCKKESVLEATHTEMLIDTGDDI